MCRGPGKARIAAPEPPPRAGKAAGHKGGSPVKNQTFGIEIETTGLGRERAAQAIAAHFGTTARYIGHHLDDWRVPMPDGRHWTVERDGSVTDPCAEVVSPVCGWEDIGMVQEVVRALRKAGAKADASLRHPHPRGPSASTPGEPAAAGQSGQRQGGPADTVAGYLAPSGAPAGASGGTGVPRRAQSPQARHHGGAGTALVRTNNGGGYTDWRRHAASHYDMSRYHLLNLHAAFSTERPRRTPSSSAPSTAHSTRARSKATSSFAWPSAIRR